MAVATQEIRDSQIVVLQGVLLLNYYIRNCVTDL